MNPHPLDTLELLPVTAPKQLFVLLHGNGGAALAMLALATLLGESFGEAAVVMPGAFEAIHLGKTERQWFPTFELTDSNRAERIAKVVPPLAAFVRQQQERFGILQSDTALVGFAEGATLALTLNDTHDGLVGRVLAFSGRYAAWPDKAPSLNTLHLLHGQQDGGAGAAGPAGLCRADGAGRRRHLQHRLIRWPRAAPCPDSASHPPASNLRTAALLALFLKPWPRATSIHHDGQLATVRPEPVEGHFAELGTGFDRLSPNGVVS